jgi:hypothetical protein
MLLTDLILIVLLLLVLLVLGLFTWGLIVRSRFKRMQKVNKTSIEA